MRWPRVRMIRHPPARVPTEMAPALARTTQVGRSSPLAAYPPTTRARKTTPIVFWASWRPWPTAIAAAESVWARRKKRSVRRRSTRRSPHISATISTAAPSAPTTGETSIGTSTVSPMTPHLTVAPAARVAPTRPPIRAWEDDEGMPRHQVTMFQVMAPTRAASTTSSPVVPVGGSTTAVTASATSWPSAAPSRAPTKFMTAASSTATRGVSARVETEVATALGASWNPLV